MTTYLIYTSNPADVIPGTGQASPVANGVSVDSTVTAAKAGGPSGYTGSTFAIQLGKWLAHLQKYDRSGRIYLASSDSGATYIHAVL